MASSSRSDHHINKEYLPQIPSHPPRSGTSSTGTTSPIEPPLSASHRFGLPSPSNAPALSSALANARLGAGSPSHDYGSRLFPKRTRELQAQEGLSPPVWGPPTSGHSTPLRETILESPNAESFPDFNQGMPETLSAPSTGVRRTRAGTLPSRFSSSPASGPGLPSMPSSSLIPKNGRPSPPAIAPYVNRSTELPPIGNATIGTRNLDSASTGTPNRIRAGSMPQRAPFAPSSLGRVMFSGWSNSRDRSSTLHSIQSQSSNGPDSPVNIRDSLADTDASKTLDYLGLVDTPKPGQATIAPSPIEFLLDQRNTTNDLYNSNANRFRSYSVNATQRYGADEDEDRLAAANYSGTLTPSTDPRIIELQEQVRRHNMDVQLFNLAINNGSNRPRARTIGVDSPSHLMRSFHHTPSRLDNSLAAADLPEEVEYQLTEAVHGLNLGDEGSLEGPTKALWLGNIPNSTTDSSLKQIFIQFGPIESTRVLTHKNCGFINFASVESAVQARATYNGKEIFPGAGPVRINFAKPHSATATPGHSGVQPSPSPDPNAKGTGEGAAGAESTLGAQGAPDAGSAALQTPKLTEVRDDILQIVEDLGATAEESKKIAVLVDCAIQYNGYIDEVPPIEEPSHNRVHDAPKLREIRKRIEGNHCPPAEVEEIAMNMLPEIAELSSDYLGNTVVQRLFEQCSESTKIAMFEQIGPHLAKIGMHKNGTWAAQKIIDVARTSPTLQEMIVQALKPYSAALFFDQYGNYVMQGCLKYRPAFTNFVFEAMLARLWDLAQGRFSSRAMRACLESRDAGVTEDQKRMIAAAIAVHSVQLATNSNGALLLTWFLDSCNFPKKRTVLAPRLVPHLVHLATNKVASTTVQKLVNQRHEAEAREVILKALLFSPNDQVLENILRDVSTGAAFIFKVLTTPTFDEKFRAEAYQNVRNVLLRIKAQPNQGYKRLMDEVSLPTRGSGSAHRDHSASRPASSRHSPVPGQAGVNGRPLYPSVANPVYAPIDMQRAGSVDSNGYDLLPLQMAAGPAPVYVPSMAVPANPQQLQYQQMLAGQRGMGYYGPVVGQVAGMEPYRSAPIAAPAFGGIAPLLQSNGLGQGMAPAMGQPPYPYGVYVAPQAPAANGNSRRGRR
ncbi:uncharacterized protein EI97DRAFT_305924 [Westerdykella ornata]|uniref:ARM repeat-containing protein n=1 Tax=Westerdykella ornata TaxID=318751 RepID=A0A6A6JK39_WESOR|nr:uncharacterized protein EI97DRAFT_305924 [Westerdykella ornata]KAF2277010.1 hypothetical protein EI97DRAFT_305924 [Westerdykella ornata]